MKFFYLAAATAGIFICCDNLSAQTNRTTTVPTVTQKKQPTNATPAATTKNNTVMTVAMPEDKPNPKPDGPSGPKKAGNVAGFAGRSEDKPGPKPDGPSGPKKIGTVGNFAETSEDKPDPKPDPKPDEPKPGPKGMKTNTAVQKTVNQANIQKNAQAPAANNVQSATRKN